MITYTWTTQRLYTLDLPTESDYVVNAVYLVEGSDDSTTPETIVTIDNNFATFTVIEDDPNYIPYDELTNDIVIGWIQNQLGELSVNSIQESIAGMINTILNPPPSPQEQPLPFSTN